MPARHSKNSTDGACFTYEERKAAGYGTQKVRLGTDSQLPLGYCCLSLKPVVDPVVSPSGHVYSRESIVEYLLTKTQELKKQKALYEAQQKVAEEETSTLLLLEGEEHARNFMAKQTAASAAVAASDAGKKKAEEEAREAYIKKALSKYDQTTREQKKETLKRTSFWLPQFQPEINQNGVEKPDKRPRSPMTGDPLRSKDLIPLSLMTDPEWTDDHSGKGKFLCSVSRKQITTQPAILIKSTGVVMLEKIAKELAYTTMTCPITGKKFKESDILPLKSGGTGFAASGQVEVKKHRPNHF